MHWIVQQIIVNWLSIAIIVSLFWGLYGWLYVEKNGNGKRIMDRIADFILDFICSFAGWVCFHILTVRLRFPYMEIKNTDFTLMIIALLGMTGVLAGGIFASMEHLAEILSKIKPRQ